MNCRLNCRHCQLPLAQVFLDLGFAPPSNAYLGAADLARPERHYPLKLRVCSGCWLVQTEDHAGADELFTDDYAYFSSVSQGWLDHAQRYAAMVSQRLALGADSLVVELACNDGYLLKNFVAAGIPCLGIEPTASTAAAAERLGIPVLRQFFGTALGRRLAQQGQQADLIVANNVLAHVPDINDFVGGMQALLKLGGTITLEFPHLARLIAHTQFDTVYHEHFSYLSLHTVGLVLQRAGLKLVDVEQLPTHGGSLRVYAAHAADARSASPAVLRLLGEEGQQGLCDLAVYASFQQRADALKDALLGFLLDQKRAGRSVAAYGAAAKGCTLLNYAGVRPDLLPYVVDAAPSKQGKYLPGSHIPVLAPQELARRRPDLVLILPWNIADEVVQQQAVVRSWGGRFVVAVPSLQILA
jgi:SAM-dependent methyltransferase